MRYVLAISGGIDSVVLLDKTATDLDFRRNSFNDAIWPTDFTVAHFDHGIRPDSVQDAEFVAKLAKGYRLNFVTERADLGKSASELTARTARYSFLNRVALGLNGQIVTAHHQDDLIETVIINLIRGTGWRGLAPMKSDIVRPMLNMNKAEITSYAINHNLNWRDDSTNYSAKYLRNRVRNMLDKIPQSEKMKIADLYYAQSKLRTDIDKEVEYAVQKNIVIDSDYIKISRYYLIMLPSAVAVEIINYLTNYKLTGPQLRQILLFTKTALANKNLEFKEIKIHATKREIMIQVIRPGR